MFINFIHRHAAIQSDGCLSHTENLSNAMCTRSKENTLQSLCSTNLKMSQTTSGYATVICIFKVNKRGECEL